MSKLRAYQINLINKVQKSFETNKRVMMQLPTGGGKSYTLAYMIKSWVEKGDRVLLGVHRKELVDQLYDTLTNIEIYPAIIHAEHKITNYSNPVQIAMIQTLVNRVNSIDEYLKENNIKPFTKLVFDEAHHISSKNNYGHIIKHYENAQVLGVTATPTRLDGKGFDDLFDDLVSEISVRELIEQGFLCDFEIYSKPVDLKGVKVRMGEFVESELEDKLNTTEVIGGLVSSWAKYAYNKRTIVFAVNVNHSQNIVRQYAAFGAKAAHIDGNTPKLEREAILDKFKAGDIQVLSNCNIVSEGFDLPACECVQLAKPTKSLVLYLQMVGRGLRPFDGKDKAIILDHGNLFDTHESPDFPFIWTLKGVEKPKALAREKEKLEEELNEENKNKLTINELKHIELVKRDKTLYTDEYIEKFVKRLEYAIKQGWKPLGAYKFWLKTDFPQGLRPSTEQLTMIAKYCRFKQGWVHFERNNLVQSGRVNKWVKPQEALAA